MAGLSILRIKLMKNWVVVEMLKEFGDYRKWMGCRFRVPSLPENDKEYHFRATHPPYAQRRREERELHAHQHTLVLFRWRVSVSARQSFWIAGSSLQGGEHCNRLFSVDPGRIFASGGSDAWGLVQTQL
jgi:hypothetical protein